MDDILALFDTVHDFVPDHEQPIESDPEHRLLGAMETYQSIPGLNGGATVYHNGNIVADLTPQLNGGALIHTYDTSFHPGSFLRGSVDTLAESHNENEFDSGDAPAVLAFDDTPADMSMHQNPLGALTVGDPYADAPYWHMQQDSNSCAVASQAGVLESLLHHEVNESELAKIAYQHGWYDPAVGTPPESVGNLIEYFGVPVDRQFDTPPKDVFDALLRGDKVIVAVNANEIWAPHTDAEDLPVAGHAVWMTGIHKDDDGGWSVVLNDTGTPDGRQEIVALPDFKKAWQDCGMFSAITRVAEEKLHVA